MTEIISAEPGHRVAFHPTAAGMTSEYAGVPVTEFVDGDVALLTADGNAARAALAAYATAMDLDLELMSVDRLTARWAVFTWQPENAECPWAMHFASEGDDMALPVHYLPA